MDFLAENNECGQNLLRLVARGNAIIAELLRLSDYIPDVFRLDTKTNQLKFSSIITDFNYFQNSDYFDHNIESNPALQDLDEEFRENHIEILSRFYLVFESVYRYITDLNRFLESLEEGIYIQQTLESVLINEDGKQLLSESLYLYGIMLLIIDARIEGSIRERMLVSYYRYNAQNVRDSNMDDVCKLLRSTEYRPPDASGVTRRPLKYPEEYFARVKISPKFVSMVIGRLRSDDIYNQVKAYPLPEQRSVALATQAGMLYTVLYFAPNILHNEQAVMREIVDKYFPDNWMISIYMGITVNLADWWSPYRAAITALGNTIQPANIKLQATKYAHSLRVMLKSLSDLLKEGVLLEEYVLDNINKLMDVMRQSNVSLRWMLLHTVDLNPGGEPNKKLRLLREQVLQDSQFKALDLYRLLLSVAQFEFRLTEMFNLLLSEKETKWAAHRLDCVQSMTELSEVFSGTKPLTRVEKNDKLTKWFLKIGDEIRSLDHQDATAAGRKIVQLIQALEEVSEFHQLEANLQVKQFLAETRNRLHQMLRTINIKEEVLIVIRIIADLSYAWQYTIYMQKGIKKDPSLVIKLRATFLKLASALDLPLMRINQANSPDLLSVSQYYSSELVAYVRKVLQVIPQTMFDSLAQIIDIQTNKMKEVPTRLDKEKLKEFAQLDHRYTVAKLTHDISVFTEGMLQMKTTLVGIVKLDPKRLLEDGIRKELVQKVASTLHETLIFNPKAKVSELGNRLTILGGKMDGYRRSFEYIQDYVNIYGLKIWQQELSRIVNFNVEQECNSFLRTKVHEWDSSYQSKEIPIPYFHPIENSGSVNFIGRLAREILRITDPKSTVYVEQLNTWYDAKSKMQVVSTRLFQFVERSLDTFGLIGLDRLFCFMMVKELQSYNKLITALFKNKDAFALLSDLQRTLMPTSAVLETGPKTYNLANVRLSKNYPALIDCILRVGQMQLLRRLIAYHLRLSSRFDAKNMCAALDSFNKAILLDVERHYRDPSLPYPDPEPSTDQEDDSSQLSVLGLLADQLESCGIVEPLNQIYMITQKQSNFPVLHLLLVTVVMPKLVYSKTIDGLTSKRLQDPVDGTAFTVGIATLLKQYHFDFTEQLVAFLAQYLRSVWQYSFERNKITAPLPVDAQNLLAFLDYLQTFSGIPKTVFETHIPPYIFDQYRTFLQC